MSKELGNTENPIENVQSHDWNKERLEQLKNLMPDLFTNDGQLNINELKKVVDPSLVTETERYEFRWFGKSNAKREAFTPTDATLVYDEHRSVNPTESENIIIEGENLAVLKLLSNSYREQVKCIYIDPPYNTGKDFVYSDKFNQDKKEYWEDAEVTENGLKIDTNTETDGRFHSNWLNMMYSRLLIARQLLKEDGVIFISIDDNEVHHLRKLCDEVFGEENFVSEISILNNPRGRQSDSFFATVHEYLLVYSKNIEKTIIYGQGLTLEQKSEFNLLDETNGQYRLLGLRQRGAASLRTDRPEMFFPIYVNPKTLEISIEEVEGYQIVLPKKSDGREGRWMWGKDKVKTDFNRLVARKIIARNEFDIFVKDFLLRDDEERTRKFKSIWDDKEINNQYGTQEVKSILGGDYMSFPKSSKYLKLIVESATKENDLILDFFAGSGTTGQAVKELNQEDGGKRKYILVQLPEATESTSEAYKASYKKISDITIERNKRVVEKIIKEKKESQPDLFKVEVNEQEQLKGLGFKVFKLQKSNFPRVEYAPDPEKTHEENVEALKKYIRDKEAQLISAFNKEELITEILLKNGFKLNYALTKQEQFNKNEILFATDGDKETLVCLDGDLAEETVEYFKTHTEQKLIVLERALDTTKKWNLKHYMKDNFKAF